MAAYLCFDKSKYPKRLEFLCISFVVINCGEKGVARPSFFLGSPESL